MHKEPKARHGETRRSMIKTQYYARLHWSSRNLCSTDSDSTPPHKKTFIRQRHMLIARAAAPKAFVIYYLRKKSQENNYCQNKLLLCWASAKQWKKKSGGGTEPLQRSNRRSKEVAQLKEYPSFNYTEGEFLHKDTLFGAATENPPATVEELGPHRT